MQNTKIQCACASDLCVKQTLNKEVVEGYGGCKTTRKFVRQISNKPNMQKCCEYKKKSYLYIDA